MADKSITERRILEAACLDFGVMPELVDDLIDLEIENEGRLRRRGLFPDLKETIEHYVSERNNDSP